MFNYKKIDGNILAVDFDSLISVNSKYSQTDIENALKNKDNKKLIEMSNYFYLFSGEYRRLLHSMANIQTFRYVYAPLITSKKAKVEKAYEDITNYLINYDVEEKNTYITFSTFLNGAFYGYERVFDDITVLQELPTQYCRSQFDENGLHAVEFDFRYFESIRNAKEKLLMFERLPEEFLTLYNQYKAGTPSETSINPYWRQLNINFTRCHYLTPDKTPFFASVFSEIVNYQEYKEIDKTRSKLDIYKILIQKIPLKNDDSGEPALDEAEAKILHSNAKSMLGSDQLVDVLTTPAEVTSVDIANKGEKQRDIIASARESMYSTYGTSQLLFNSGDTSIGLEKSIKNDESLITTLVAEYEKHYNTRFKTISKLRFFIKDLGITIYNEKEKIMLLKEQATLGGAKLPYFVASTGMRQYEFISMVTYESESGLLDLLVPLSTSYTQSGEAGAPESENPSEETVKQKDKETQKTRAKK